MPSRLSPVFLVALSTLVAGCAAPGLSEPSDAIARVLSCREPCDVPVEEGPDGAGEPMVAVNPTNPDHLVAGSFDYEEDAAGNLHFWLKSHVSRDGGVTWESARLPGGPGAEPTHPLATYTSTGDPVITILSDGDVLYTGIAAREAQRYSAAGAAYLADLAIFVARSTDGGLTYPEVTIVAEGRGGYGFAYAGPAGAPLLTPMDFHDKQWITRGPDGVLLLTWTNFQFPPADEPQRVGANDIMFVASEDGGRTWSESAHAAKGNFQGSAPHVGLDGTWYVAFLDLPVAGEDPRGKPAEVFLAISEDRGNTWSVTPASEAATTEDFPALTSVRLPDGRERLLLATALADEDKRIPAVLTSDDKGQTWSESIALDAPEGPGKPLPALAAGENGVAYAAFYHALDEDGAMDFRVTAITEAGLVGPVIVNREPVKPGYAQRDYAGLAALPGGAFTVWISGEPPNTDVHGARVQFG